jgi:prevent-host-death family protein
MNVKTKRKSAVWQLQEAKAMLSEVVNASVRVPQFITVRGKEKAVVLSMENYNKIIRPKQTLYELIQSSPLAGVELELPPDQPVVFENLFKDWPEE